MRKLILILLCSLMIAGLNAQSAAENLIGKVSFVSSQNIYVKFNSSAGIAEGDTLYISSGNTLVPALIVNSLSSVSCLCSSITEHTLPVDHIVIARVKTDSKKPVEKDAVIAAGVPAIQALNTDTVRKSTEAPANGPGVRGSISVNSYSDFYSTETPASQRFRYTLSLNAMKIGGSRFSFETYVSFRHKTGEWEEVQNDIFSALKIYNLAVRYDLNKTTSFSLGRRINPRITNMGAIDGIQFEKTVKNFSFGLLAGSRPDYRNYSFDPTLFQYGAYVAYDTRSSGRTTQSSIAYAEQTNDFKTDRRFIYFQHSNNLIKNLNFFSTLEVDLFSLQDDIPQNTPDLTGLYLSLSYRLSGKISLNGSYDARKNVIYYETYKTFTDRILEEQMRQGYRLSGSWRMTRKMSVGIRAGYRFMKSDPHPSRSLNGYYTYNDIGGSGLSATISGTYLETSYLNSAIAGINILKNFPGGKFEADVGYRLVGNRLPENKIDFIQHIGEVNIYWNISEKLSFSANYEGTFEGADALNRVYLQLRMRF